MFALRRNKYNLNQLMKLIKIAEAQEMVGMVLPRVEGVLVTLYDQKTGEKDGKPWAMQNGVIEDDTGGMKIVFSGHDAISLLMKGQRIQLEAFTSKQHGLVGIKVKENTWKEKTTKEIWVTGTAKILFPDVQDAPHDEDAPKASTAPKTESYDRKWIPSRPKANVDAFDAASDRVAQYRMMYEICWKEAVAFMGKTKLAGLVDDGDDTRQVATSFFINAVREGLDRGLTVKAEKEEEPDEIPM